MLCLQWRTFSDHHIDCMTNRNAINDNSLWSLSFCRRPNSSSFSCSSKKSCKFRSVIWKSDRNWIIVAIFSSLHWLARLSSSINNHQHYYFMSNEWKCARKICKFPKKRFSAFYLPLHWCYRKKVVCSHCLCFWQHLLWRSGPKWPSWFDEIHK